MIILAAAAITAAGCTKFNQPQQYSREYGKPIVFGSAENNGSNTRAAYSGTITGGYERIDWTYGDTIRIYCAQASAESGPYKDYYITSGTIKGNNASSRAGIQCASTISLQWGEAGLHKFTSLYPAPGHGVDGCSVKEDSVTCVIPVVQTNGEITCNSGNFTAAADKKYIYLAGYASANGGEDVEKDPVQIAYDPAFTAFEFTLTNGFTSDERMIVDSVGIKTSGTDFLAGKYAVGVVGIDTLSGVLTSSKINMYESTGAREVKMKFSSPVSVAKDSSVTFTLFVQPSSDVDSITFWFKDTGNCRRSFAFRYSADSSWVSFAALHKAKIKGLIAPESAGWTINMIPLVSAWSSDAKDIDADLSTATSFITPTVTDWEDGESGTIKLK